jgi:four helix bundle protein
LLWKERPISTFKRFEEIQAWQRARELTREVYEVTRQGAFAKGYGLRDQIRKSAVSVMSNIAEGFERGGRREFLQFLAVAKGSAGELTSQLYVAMDQSYLTRESFEQLHKDADDAGRLIGGLMNYLQRTRIQGLKYKALILVAAALVLLF